MIAHLQRALSELEAADAQMTPSVEERLGGLWGHVHREMIYLQAVVARLEEGAIPVAAPVAHATE